jgi:hypothetical protein
MNISVTLPKKKDEQGEERGTVWSGDEAEEDRVR